MVIVVWVVVELNLNKFAKVILDLDQNELLLYQFNYYLWGDHESSKFFKNS